jgi:hypothetical protein
MFSRMLEAAARTPPQLPGLIASAKTKTLPLPPKASCGIRAHDLPLTERVLCQLS